jgi:hypothetical protein
VGAPDDRPTQATMAALSGELRGLLLETEPGRVAKRSRDFHWFSPILAEELSEVRADAGAMVNPGVWRQAAACSSGLVTASPSRKRTPAIS